MRAYVGAMILVVATVLSVLAVVAWQRSRLHRRIAAHLESEVKPAPPRLSSPVPLPIDVPPGDESSGPLWIGQDGTDAYGYPTRQLDEVALQSVVRARQFERAQRWFDEVQRLFEEDYRREYWPQQALRAFETADPALGAKLDEWVKRSANSYAAHAARGAHRVAIAWAQRGTDYLKDTTAEQLAGYHETMRAAAQDFSQALRLKPRLHAGLVYLIRIAASAHGTAPSKEQSLARALEVCPLCAAARVRILDFERPVWGGSIDGVKAYVASWLPEAALNPRLALLSSYEDQVRCDILEREEKYEEALTACDRAVAKAPIYVALRVDRAWILQKLDRHDRALADLDDAYRSDPQNPSVLVRRPTLLLKARRYREAVDDLLRARRLDPVDVSTAKHVQRAVQSLVYAGWEASQSGDNQGALALFDMALELDPQNREARRRRLAATSTVALGSEADSNTKALEQRVEASPDDFALHRQLDDTYYRQGRLDDIIAMWTKFLAKHPDHGLAYWERAGTYRHKHDMERAMADAREACRLGVKPACAVTGKSP